jgi:hypothetical protein
MLPPQGTFSIPQLLDMALGGRLADRAVMSGCSRKADMPEKRVKFPQKYRFESQNGHSCVRDFRCPLGQDRASIHAKDDAPENDIFYEKTPPLHCLTTA